MAADPRDLERIYLGTGEGVLYRSTDGGLHWQRTDPGFPLRGVSLDEIAVDQSGVVLVGYWQVRGNGGGVARSTDGGRTFTVLKGIDGQSVRALAVAPSDARVIAAGTLNGVFLSRDAGRTWARITPEKHPDLRNVGSVVFDPSDPRVIYAGTWHLGWKTRDGGATWKPVHDGMIDDSDVMTLTIDHHHPETIYATACSGIYRSTEGGTRWTKLEGIPYSSRRTRAFALSGDGDRLLAGTTEGLWTSDDAGESWARLTPEDLVVNALVVQSDGTIVLGTEGAGVLRSTDDGRTWSDSNAGFSERFVSRIMFDPERRRVFVAVWGDPRHGGVFVSEGVRGPWTRLGKGLVGRQVLSLAMLGDSVLAGTDDGIYAWTPNGDTWSRLPAKRDGREVRTRVTDLVVLPPNGLLAATPQGVHRSTDRGRTWTRPTLGEVEEVCDVAVSTQNPRRAVAATRGGFFRSDDGGATWSRGASELEGVTPHAVVFAPTDDRVLFATTTGGLFRSGDRGATWRRVNGGIPHSDLTGIAVHPDGLTIYASDFTWGGVFRSVDGGASWERMPTEGLATDRVWALSLDPGASLLASSSGGLHLLVTTSMASRVP